MKNVIDAWKNKDVFDKQLKINMQELNGNLSYPKHWLESISLIDKFKPKSILEVGCGCGAFSEVCRKEFPNIEYMGIDYSADAVKLAKNTWKNNFNVMDYKDLTKEFVNNYDSLYLSAFLAVLPNADEAFEFILSLVPKSLIIMKTKIHTGPSIAVPQNAYDTIQTVEYYHNIEKFMNIIEKYGYDVKDRVDLGIYLTKKRVII
tara:strand:+ start:6178 stop:6789 length:612 start_codon:yes stop_codon:yes gene_type:complete